MVGLTTWKDTGRLTAVAVPGALGCLASPSGPFVPHLAHIPGTQLIQPSNLYTLKLSL